MDLELDLHGHTCSGGPKRKESAQDLAGVLLGSLTRDTTGCRDDAKKGRKLRGSKLTMGTEELPRIL